AWAMLDVLTLGLPLAGPGAQLAGATIQEATALMQTGMDVASVWGYLSTLFSVSSAIGNGGGSASGGGSSSSGSTGSSGPGQWVEEDQSGWSKRARNYQQQISGRSGQAYDVNGVKFDGFDGNNLLDAKGPGYGNFLDKNGQFKPWFEKSGG